MERSGVSAYQGGEKQGLAAAERYNRLGSLSEPDLWEMGEWV
jgi:hypothetical protein